MPISPIGSPGPVDQSLPQANYQLDTEYIAVKKLLESPAKNGLLSDPITYQSYSGTDITATILVPGEKAELILGELQTISYSIHRENTPVRHLGHVNVRGFVQGPRTIAGSLIFTQFSAYTFYRLEQYRILMGQGMYALSDMLPPFDVVLSFQNEMGSFSKMKILGLTIVDEGGTMSIDDMITEQTYTYMARGIQPLVSYIPEGFTQTEPTHSLVELPRINNISFR